ncbi:MAG: tRNA (guanosine(37)-N1)-methyltransferase TrmD [Planctomycetota bacterium]
MLVYILTLFPDALEPFLSKGVFRVARDNGIVDVRLLNFRDFAKGKHRNVDDRPFGGGPGMLLRPEPIFAAVEWIESREGPFHKILLTPDGTTFRQPIAQSLAKTDRLLFLCGRYEGFDQRILDGFEWERLSIGDFVLSGGELPALVILEATIRLIPGVLGDEESSVSESFNSGLLDFPQYTRPREFRGVTIPDVLVSGDHEAIDEWRDAKAREHTRKERPDMLPQNEQKPNPKFGLPKLGPKKDN